MSAGARWFSPAPSEIASSRLSLDLGLRRADLWFRERIVPELGGVWFVRQLSWPVAALALHAALAASIPKAPRPTAIAHGVEALACKLEFHYRVVEAQPRRILGMRAFGRDGDDAWSFARLRQPAHYVRNTHRQTASRVLRKGPGLGFVIGPRFDRFALEPVGDALARALLEQSVGQGGTSLGKWLLRWLRGEQEVPANAPSLWKALSPAHPTKAECDVVWRRLFEVDTPQRDARVHLAKALGGAAEMADLDDDVVQRLRAQGRDAQARDLRAARAFGAMLERALDVIAPITARVESGEIALATLAADKAVTAAIKKLRAAGERFEERAGEAGVSEPDSDRFARAIRALDASSLLGKLVGDAGELLSLADGIVGRGSLFRVIHPVSDDVAETDGEVDDERPADERTDRTFRAWNLHAIQRDLRAGRSA